METSGGHLGGSERGNYLTIRKVGENLELTPTPEGVARAREFLEERAAGEGEGSDMQLADLLEDFLGNGWTEVRPEHVGALTSAFMMSDDGQLDDEGNWQAFGENARVYAHMNYQVEDPIEAFARGEAVRFEGAVVEAKPETKNFPGVNNVI